MNERFTPINSCGTISLPEIRDEIGLTPIEISAIAQAISIATNLSVEKVEQVIREMIKETNDNLDIKVKVDNATCPGEKIK